MTFSTEINEKIEQLVRFYYSKFNLKTPFSDMLNGVVLSLFTSKYLDRYDQTRPLHNYLSGFVYNYFCKIYKRESSPVNRAESLDYSIFDNENTAPPSAKLRDNSASDFELATSIKAIIKELERTHPYNSFVLYSATYRFQGIYTIRDKKVIPEGYFILPRSHAEVLRLLYAGLTQSGIKDILLTSKSWVSKIVASLSKNPDLLDLLDF